MPWRVVMASRTAGRRARLSSDPVSRGRGLRYIAALALRAFRRAGRSHRPDHGSPAMPQPIEVIATLLFAVAVLHTFSVPFFARLAHKGGRTRASGICSPRSRRCSACGLSRLSSPWRRCPAVHGHRVHGHAQFHRAVVRVRHHGGGGQPPDPGTGGTAGAAGGARAAAAPRAGHVLRDHVAGAAGRFLHHRAGRHDAGRHPAARRLFPHQRPGRLQVHDAGRAVRQRVDRRVLTSTPRRPC